MTAPDIHIPPQAITLLPEGKCLTPPILFQATDT